MALKHDNDEHTGCCDGGCPICIEQPPSYVHGYADGKGKAHFEIRYMRANHTHGFAAANLASPSVWCWPGLACGPTPWKRPMPPTIPITPVTSSVAVAKGRTTAISLIASSSSTRSGWKPRQRRRSGSPGGFPTTP